MTAAPAPPAAPDTAVPSSPVALTAAQLDRHGTGSPEVYTAGFYPSDWDFVVRSLLGKASRGGADAGEVLATIASIAPGDHEGWVHGWTTLGTRIAGAARTAAERGHRISAARAYLRAANYLAVAVNALSSALSSALSGQVASDDLLPAFAAHRAAWDGFVAATAWRSERVDIPYETGSMPGWLFHPDDSDTPRPTLVVNNGSDGALSGLWCGAAEGGLQRGYRVLLFDGPGQQSMLFDRGIPFRPDWEHVLTPVLDFLLDRVDVRADQVALYGVSQAGYWVPRALAFEHRFAAAIADGGVVDIGRTWFEKIPAPMLELYRQGRTELFDQQMDRALQARGGEAARRTWQFRARPYGVTGYAALLDEAARYTVRDVAHLITTPLYITDPDGEQFFPGQPAELAALTPTAELATFTQDEGAGYHCQPMARELTEQRMFDWLDEHVMHV